MDIKPTFDREEADALETLTTFIGSWIAADPRRLDALPRSESLRKKLIASAKDIRGSTFSPDPVSIDEGEANALVFFIRIFAAANPGNAANGRLVSWAVLASQIASPAQDYAVSRSPWHHATKLSRRILIVSGRNRKAHNELVLWLKNLHLEPVILESRTAQGSVTAAEALEAAVSSCGTGIVLMTPDDEGRLSCDEDGRTLRPGQTQKLSPRARQNVILELGMLWGHIGRERVVLLLDNSVDVGTDTAGFMTVRFTQDVRTAFEDLRQRLQAMGIISLRPSEGVPAKP